MERAWRAERERAEEIRRVREEVERRRFELEDAQRRGDYQRASELRYSVLPELEKKLPTEGPEGAKASGEGARVTSDDVARVLSKMTGIPTTTLQRGDRARLLDLEQVLGARVKGQEPAISAVASAIRLSRAGLHPGNRPVASFLFLGQTGTGKTELAKALAAETTGTERNLITINMYVYPSPCFFFFWHPARALRSTSLTNLPVQERVPGQAHRFEAHWSGTRVRRI